MALGKKSQYTKDGSICAEVELVVKFLMESREGPLYSLIRP